MMPGRMGSDSQVRDRALHAAPCKAPAAAVALNRLPEPPPPPLPARPNSCPLPVTTTAFCRAWRAAALLVGASPMMCSRPGTRQAAATSRARGSRCRS